MAHYAEQIHEGLSGRHAIHVRSLAKLRKSFSDLNQQTWQQDLDSLTGDSGAWHRRIQLIRQTGTDFACPLLQRHQFLFHFCQAANVSNDQSAGLPGLIRNPLKPHIDVRTGS